MKKILIVEDNEDILESTKEILELKGFEVQIAINGKIGLALAQQECPDLIISDIMMPQMDGFEMLNILNKNGKTAMIPFIFLTAKTQKFDRLQGAFYGADRYLTKPFTAAELLKNVDEVLRD